MSGQMEKGKKHAHPAGPKLLQGDRGGDRWENAPGRRARCKLRNLQDGLLFFHARYTNFGIRLRMKKFSQFPFGSHTAKTL